MKLGLVTVLFKSDDVLEGFFKSLSIQKYTNYHLYLIDNSPTPSTNELLQQLSNQYPQISFSHVKNETNVGVAKGNNQGIELALSEGSEYVLLLNNDIEFYQEDLIDHMVEIADDRLEHLLIPKIFYFGGRIIWMAGGKTSALKAISSHVGVDEEDNGQYDNIRHFDYAPTCFMLVSRKVFESIGLMDESYFVYYDDTDFLYRAKNAGFKILYLPKLEIFHKVSSSTGGGESLFSIFYLNRNRLFFIRKNLKFPFKYLALTYTLLTRAIWLLKYKKPEREQLLKAISNGLNNEIK
jgi:GT2 family glycosyltransferase